MTEYQNENDRLEALAKYLNEKYMDLLARKGRSFSIAKMGREMGVKSNTMSTWMNAARLPDYSNALRIGRYFGDDTIYDICGYLPPMPENPELQTLLKLWDKIPVDRRSELLEEFETYQK